LGGFSLFGSKVVEVTALAVFALFAALLAGSSVVLGGILTGNNFL
jgi:hypothetical protein